MRNLEYLTPLLQKEVDKNAVAGSQLMVLQHGRVLYRHCFGYADMEKKIPMVEDSIYRLYSMTKPVTAAAAMILYERGMLDLYAPVSEYLPAYRGQKVLTEQGLADTQREVQVRDLLNMTAGIVYPDEWFEAGRRMKELYDEFYAAKAAGHEFTTREFIDRIAAVPLEFQPGGRWRYGACADVCGAVIEEIAGMKYSEFLKKEIFEPLQMNDTGFYVPEEKQHRFCELYEYNEAEGCLKPLLENELALGDYKTPPVFESAGAGLVSTADDYSRFAGMLLNGGSLEGERILGRKTVDFLCCNQLTPQQQKYCDWEALKGYGYGNYFRILIDKAAAASNGSLGEIGWDGWCGTYMAIDRSEDLVILYFIQRACGGNTGLVRKIRDIIYSSLD